MGRLIIDGNSVFEIDEACIKNKKTAKQCGLDKYLKESESQNGERKIVDYDEVKKGGG